MIFFFQTSGFRLTLRPFQGTSFPSGSSETHSIRLHFASVRLHQLSISLYLEVVTRIYFFPLIEKRKDKKKKRQLVPIELVLGARFLTQISLLHSLSITQEKAAPLGFTWLRQLVSADAAFKPMSDSMPQALPSSAEKHHPH